MTEYKVLETDELFHWGILGMKWGIRRYQNPDGTLTEAGKQRRAKKEQKWQEKKQKIIAKGDARSALKNADKFSIKEIDDVIAKYSATVKLSEAITKNAETGAKRMASMDSVMKSTASTFGSIVSTYNSAAKLSNALFGTKLYTTSDNPIKKNDPQASVKQKVTKFDKRIDKDEYFVDRFITTTVYADGSKTTEVSESVKPKAKNSVKPKVDTEAEAERPKVKSSKEQKDKKEDTKK